MKTGKVQHFLCKLINKRRFYCIQLVRYIRTKYYNKFWIIKIRMHKMKRSQENVSFIYRVQLPSPYEEDMEGKPVTYAKHRTYDWFGTLGVSGELVEQSFLRNWFVLNSVNWFVHYKPIIAINQSFAIDTSSSAYERAKILIHNKQKYSNCMQKVIKQMT